MLDMQTTQSPSPDTKFNYYLLRHVSKSRHFVFAEEMLLSRKPRSAMSKREVRVYLSIYKSKVCIKDLHLDPV